MNICSIHEQASIPNIVMLEIADTNSRRQNRKFSALAIRHGVCAVYIILVQIHATSMLVCVCVETSTNPKSITNSILKPWLTHTRIDYSHICTYSQTSRQTRQHRMVFYGASLYIHTYMRAPAQIHGTFSLICLFIKAVTSLVAHLGYCRCMFLIRANSGW